MWAIWCGCVRACVCVFGCSFEWMGVVRLWAKWDSCFSPCLFPLRFTLPFGKVEMLSGDVFVNDAGLQLVVSASVVFDQSDKKDPDGKMPPFCLTLPFAQSSFQATTCGEA